MYACVYSVENTIYVSYSHFIQLYLLIKTRFVSVSQLIADFRISTKIDLLYVFV